MEISILCIQSDEVQALCYALVKFEFIGLPVAGATTVHPPPPPPHTHNLTHTF